MVSVIIASADPVLLQQVHENIKQTIGLPFELLAVENSKGARGICDIYNEGIANASYDILCFMHEDVAFETEGWGRIVADIFQQHANLGIIGVTGSTYKSIMPIGWPSQGSPETERSNLIQSFKYRQKATVRASINPHNEKLAMVAVVDGVWMCVRKEVTTRVCFDSSTFRHFHGYDIDFCLAAGKQYDIAVTYDVLLQHSSEGNIDRRWMEESLFLYRKWERELPRSTVPLNKWQIRKIEKQNFRYWLRLIHRLGFAKHLAFWLLHRPHIRRVLGWKYYLKFHYSILNEYYLRKPSGP